MEKNKALYITIGPARKGLAKMCADAFVQTEAGGAGGAGQRAVL